MDDLSDALERIGRTLGLRTATAAGVGFGVSKDAVAAAITAERAHLAIRAVYPPEHVDAAIKEAIRRWSTSLTLTLEQAFDSVVQDHERAWLPRAVD